jgi:gliding motility-associated-like protein
MKRKSFIAGISIVILLMIGNLAFSQALIYSESFETDGQGTRYTANPYPGTGSIDAYFKRGTNATISMPNLINTDGIYFYGAEDTEGSALPGECNLTTSIIQVNGYHNLEVQLRVAAPRNNKFDTLNDYLKIEYNIDSLGWVLIGAFRNDGSPANSSLNLDTDLDGIGEGIALTDSFQQFTFNIPQTGKELQIRILVYMDDVDEEVAFDLIQVNGDSSLKANFNFNNACLGDSTYFVNTSTGTASNVNYIWAFDNDSIFDDAAAIQDPAYLFALSDTFMVGLKVFTPNDTDSVFKQVIVHPNPVAAFSVDDTSKCQGNTFFFTNNSHITPTSYLNYVWNFGDSIFSSDTNTSHLYAIPGNYTVTLKVSSTLGCEDTFSRMLYLNPNPIADFTLSDTLLCANDTFGFTNNSSISPSGTLSYFWDLDDGKTAQSKDTSNAYPTDGTYNIKLITSSSAGCKDSITKTIQVNSLLKADFTASLTCFGDATIFTNSSHHCIPIDTILWDLDSNGLFNDTSAASFSFLFNKPDTFWIGIKVITANDTDSIYKQVIVHPLPQADFIVSDSNACLGNSISFLDNSQINTAYTLSYFWDFDDGTTAAVKDTSHIFSLIDSFDVKHIVTSNYGCRDSILKRIWVYNIPTADFSINDTFQCSSDTFIFTNASSISPAEPLSYFWDLGDGKTSFSQDTSNLFALNGIYSIKLITSTQMGCKDSMIKNITVNSDLKADFTATRVCLGDSTNLNSTSRICGLVSYFWDMDNDGVFNDAAGSDVRYRFLSAGTKMVGLVVLNISDTDTIYHTVIVDSLPLVDYTINNTVQNISGNNFVFTNTSTGASTYMWDFGDGNTTGTVNATHSYASVGDFSVKLVATTIHGCKDSTIKQVKTTSNLDAGFTTNKIAQCANNNLFLFTDTSKSSGNIIIRNWDLDEDGLFNDASGTSASASYHQHGNILIGLYLVTDQGDTAYVYQQITILPSPVANFTSNVVCQGRLSTFRDSSLIDGGASIIKYYWDFDFDGVVDDSTGPLATYRFLTGGTHLSLLVVVADNGCEDAIVKQVDVGLNPLADFLINNACEGDSAEFINVSSIPAGDTIINYLWDYGDGNQAIIKSNPKHVYDFPGDYNVSLVALSALGCKDTANKVIHIKANPNIVFFFPKDTSGLYAGDDFDVIVTGSTYDSIKWLINGAIYQGSQGQNAFTFNQDGSYTAIAYDTNGCKSSDSFLISFMNMPVELIARNIITPNQDGINDLWIIQDLNFYKPVEVRIFNRYGDELYSSNDYQNDWDGTYEGEYLPRGTYYYIIKLKDSSVYKGTINIVY